MSSAVSYYLAHDHVVRRFYSLFCLWLVNITTLIPLSEISGEQNKSPLQLKSYTAIGDSFAAGLRAIPGGHLPWCNDKGSDQTNCTTAQCLQNLGSYPYRLGVSNEWNFDDFQFLACVGSNTDSCKENQVNGPRLGTPDVVSVHIGGNNNDSFGPVLMNCVYRRGWGCEEALKKAESTIYNIGVHFDNFFDAIKARPLRDGSQSRYVFAMGYPTFYNTTAICSCQSWQINWPSAGENGMRQRLNTLIDMMNEKIQNATDRAGDDFHFVGTKDYFEGHRLCDDTDGVCFQYFLEWKKTALSTANGIKVQEIAQTIDFQDGPFHPNLDGQKAFLRALTDAIRRVRQDEQQMRWNSSG